MVQAEDFTRGPDRVHEMQQATTVAERVLSAATSVEIARYCAMFAFSPKCFLLDG